jgi:protoheme IX farnesyltransferase
MDFTFKDRLNGFISLIRPIFFVLTPLNAGSAAVLALGGYPSFGKCLAGFFAVALASCAVNVFNDYTDRERDKLIWPGRAIPSGRIKPREALLVAVTALAASLIITWFAFNLAAFILLLIAATLGGVYSACLRNKAGYLSLPPIVGLIYLGGWAALSPDTLFSSWLPWYLYLLGVFWQTAHIMVYYPLHLTPDSEEKAPPALFFTPSPRAAVGIGFAFTILTLLLGIGLFFIASLGPLYLILVIIAGGYALFRVIPLLKDPCHQERGIKAFSSLSVFRMAISAAVLLTVFISQF